MKRMKTRHVMTRAVASLLLAMIVPTAALAAADVVTVGTAGSGHSLPIGAYNKYVLTQQVYTATEISHSAGKIWSIGFNTVNGGVSRHLSIYVTHFDESGIWSYHAPTENDLMFSGDVYFKPGQWNAIDFDKPFEYNGTSNLLITICDDTGTKGDYSSLSNRYYNPGSTQLIYATSDDVAYNPTDANESTGFTTISNWKAQIQLTFDDLPTPSGLTVSDITDESALIQCSLRGDATAWNLRYRRIADDGEEEMRWTQESDLDTRSFTIEGLDFATKYEAQVQAVFDEENLSDWTASLTFATNCCPPEDMCEILYSMNVRNANSAAFRIVDDETGIEQAYVQFNINGVSGGAIPLCVGRKYNVYWVKNTAYSYQMSQCNFTLFFIPGDEFFTMPFNSAPEEDGLLTSFVMECGDYCAVMPRFVTVANVDYNSATFNYTSATQGEQVAYSLTEDFDPDTAPQQQATHALSENTQSFTLTGLEPLTSYYVRMRSVCDGESGGVSRWTKAVKITTGSRFDAPSQVTAKPVNSTTEQLSWQGLGEEKAFNLFYRKQADGNPVNADDVATIGGGNGEGFRVWEDGVWMSYGEKRPYSNTLFVGGVPAGSSFGFKAGQLKTGFGKTTFLYGMVRQEAGLTPEQAVKKIDKECLNDADRQAIINELQNKKNELVAELAQNEISHQNGEISDDEYNQKKEELEGKIASYDDEIEELNNLPTDAQKMEKMKELESAIDDYNVQAYQNEISFINGEISEEEYKENKTIIEAGLYLSQEQLSKLRAITSTAENADRDGFSVGSQKSSSPANSRTKDALENETYVFFIRHANDNGMLLVKDLTITPAESLNEWICVPNIKGTEYTLAGLEPETAYEVMVEPIYENGLTGSRSPITVFTTIGAETEPTESEFSVGEDKKVNFSRGNLRYDGDVYEGTWSMAKQQYDVLGDANIDVYGSRSYPATPTDLLCWSTTENNYGVSNYYYYDDEEALPLFMADFAEWGESAALINDLGAGWRTLSKDEWDYLLNQRENAEQLRMTTTVAGVKGLLILPDEWSAPDGIVLSEEITAEQWTAIDQTGVVFLPAAGQLSSTREDFITTTTLTEACTYWTSTPGDDKSGMNAFILSIGDDGISLDEMLNRRIATAVRLVKNVEKKLAQGDINGDGGVNVGDVSTVYEVILGLKTDKATVSRADLNGDNKVNAGDISTLYGIILGKQQ